jgi:hypothetical protein
MLLLVVSAWIARRVAIMKLDHTWTEVEWAELPEVRTLQEYVRVDTSPETGSELAGARFLAERLQAAGLEAHIERLGERGANLWAILEGRRREALVLHNHIDVFPAENAEEWEHPPFAGIIDPPHLWGRGAFDMKSVSVAQLQALLALVASGEKPERSVIFLATGSEEVGSELGTRWVLARHPELVSRFWAVLTEGGIVEPITREEIKYWGIEFSHKQITEAWVCSDRREPLETLHDYLEQHRGTAEAVLTPEVAAFAAHYAPSRQRRSYRERLADLTATVDHPLWVAELPPYLNAMLLNEVVALLVRDDPGGGYRMKLVLRLLPGAELDSALSSCCPTGRRTASPLPCCLPAARRRAAHSTIRPTPAWSRRSKRPIPTPPWDPTSCPGTPLIRASSARRAFPLTASRRSSSSPRTRFASTPPTSASACPDSLTGWRSTSKPSSGWCGQSQLPARSGLLRPGRAPPTELSIRSAHG